jgi:hypothetical protein
VEYEIDLTNENAQRLRESLGQWTGPARKVSGRARRGTARRVQDGGQTAKVREWAKANGYTVSDRGRIAADVRAAYDAAN